MKRYLVEVRVDVFDPAIATYLEIGPGGTLVFKDARLNIIEAHAPGTWLSVVEDTDE